MLFSQGAVAVAASGWGLCKDGQRWQIDPEAHMANTAIALVNMTLISVRRAPGLV
jgi:hypothetical protein